MTTSQAKGLFVKTTLYANQEKTVIQNIEYTRAHSRHLKILDKQYKILSKPLTFKAVHDILRDSPKLILSDIAIKNITMS